MCLGQQDHEERGSVRGPVVGLTDRGGEDVHAPAAQLVQDPARLLEQVRHVLATLVVGEHLEEGECAVAIGDQPVVGRQQAVPAEQGQVPGGAGRDERPPRAVITHAQRLEVRRG